MTTGSRSDIQLENELFRVTSWSIEPGGFIPMHRHDYAYVVVPLVTADMHVVTSDGDEFVTELVTGQSYTRHSGATHRVENRGESEVLFVEIERLS